MQESALIIDRLVVIKKAGENEASQLVKPPEGFDWLGNKRSMPPIG